MQTTGAKLIASLEGDVNSLLSLKIPMTWYTEADKELLEFVHNHILSYGVVPDPSTIATGVGVHLPKAAEPPAFYADEIKTRYLHAVAKKALLSAQKHLKAKDPLAAFDVMVKATNIATATTHQQDMINFASDEAMKLVQENYVAKAAKDGDVGIPTGWNYIDQQGRLEGGDVMSFLGLSGTGKTWMLIYMAMFAWELGHPVVFFSMEIKTIKILERLTAFLAKVSVTQLQQGKMATKTYNKKVKSISMKGRPDFIVVDGNMTTSVEEVGTISRQLGSDAIYLDGAYLLQSPKKYGAVWEHTKYTIEYLKSRVATAQNVPLIASFQFNNDQAKVSKKSVQDTIANTGLEHIAGGKAIGDTSSVVVGLFQELTAATLYKKTLSVIKGRDGQTGTFDVNWIFNQYPFMDFSEIVEQDVSEFQFD